MISIFLFAILLTITALFIKSNFDNIITRKTDRFGNTKFELSAGKSFFTSISLVFIALIAPLVQPFKLEKVLESEIALKVKLMGNKRGLSDIKYKTGLVVVNEWTEILARYETNLQQMTIDPQEVITKGGFPATIKPTFNYKVVKSNVPEMYLELRKPLKEIEQTWLTTLIVGSINDVSNRWEVDAIFNNREKFESEIKALINERAGKWMTFEQFRTNITPPQPLVEAITKKTKAVQDVQVAENQKLVAIAEADRKIAVARGDSAEKIIQSKAEALSIEIKTKELSKTYIDYVTALRWDGKLSTTLVQGSGSGVLLSLPNK